MSTAEWIASVKTCVPLVNLTYPGMAGWGQTADQYEPQMDADTRRLKVTAKYFTAKFAKML